MVTGVGHRDQAVGRVRPRALRLPKLLSATLESIHPNTPPPPPHTHTHPSLILTPHHQHHHPSHFPPLAPPDMHIHQTYANQTPAAFRFKTYFFFLLSFFFISLISQLVPAPLLFSSPLSSILISSPLHF